MSQEQDQASGYQEQTTHRDGEPENAEHEGVRQPMNGYEFWLEVLHWVEENWLFLLIFSGTVLLPLLEAVLHLLTSLVGGH